MANYTLNYSGAEVDKLLEKIDTAFGEETVMGDTITWDGNTDGLDFVDGGDGMVLYKISDATPTLTEAQQGGVITLGGEIVEFTSDMVATMGESLYAFAGSPEAGMVVLEDNADLFGITIPSKGIYMVMPVPYTLTINGYTGFEMTEVKTIDSKYLPISGVEIVNIIPESDGSTSSDKTYAEIKAMFLNGIFVVAHFAFLGMVHCAPITVVSDSEIKFLQAMNANGGVINIVITSSDEVTAELSA